MNKHEKLPVLSLLVGSLVCCFLLSGAILIVRDNFAHAGAQEASDAQVLERARGDVEVWDVDMIYAGSRLHGTVRRTIPKPRSALVDSDLGLIPVLGAQTWTVQLEYGGVWIVYDATGSDVAGGMSQQDAEAAARRYALSHGIRLGEIRKVVADWEKE
jgi:hypothetical protein